jgi:hypothetical protein
LIPDLFQDWDAEAHMTRIAMNHVAFERNEVIAEAAREVRLAEKRRAFHEAQNNPLFTDEPLTQPSQEDLDDVDMDDEGPKSPNVSEPNGDADPASPHNPTADLAAPVAGPLDGRLTQLNSLTVDGGRLTIFCRPDTLFPTWWVEEYIRMIRRYARPGVIVLDLEGLNLATVNDRAFVTILEMEDDFCVTLAGHFTLRGIYQIFVYNDSGAANEVVQARMEPVRSSPSQVRA